ncbi:hypothetical protein CYPRO_3087 [Cyclonatronum proteinivorum]|uniref:Ion transporter n=1 Tax=Cyclonatronum proteinivorum TaxID=1457365 RepID=A0A345UPC0_9BACT|nr:ion transporter [Cyclonatronum proteinivorum]AXJ02322.1 hypothetical protein CYPRO_3087 [Cyclonatronum proteinivorum]
MGMGKNNTGKSKETPRKVGYLAGDFIMLFLLLVNLAMISFDWLFQSRRFQGWIEWLSPAFFEFYATNIHVDFILYDLIFISIFLTEFFVRWIYSIREREFSKWYYYPFVYWYDLIGCIPIGGFRFLRLLRIVTIMVRLQRIGYIDMRKFALFRFGMRYLNFLVQELTDRVVLNILSNVRSELREGTPVIDRIVDDVLRPRQVVLVNWISMRLQLAASKGYALHEDDIRAYVNERIDEAVEKNREIQNLEAIPFVGRVAASQIEGAIRDIVFSVVHGIIRDLGSSRNKALVEDLSELLLDEDTENGSDQVRMLNIQVAEMLSESMGIVMDRVKERRWNPRELEENEARLQQKLEEEAGG